MKKFFLLVLLLSIQCPAFADSIDLSSFYYPSDAFFDTDNNPYASAGTLDANGERSCFSFTFPSSNILRRVITRTANIVTGDTIDYRIETADANGFPSGNFYCANSTGTYSPPATDDNLHSATNNLTEDCSVTRGDFAFLCFVRVGGTFNGIPISGNYSSTLSVSPYSVSSTTASGYLKGSLGGFPCALLNYSDGTYEAIHPESAMGAITNVTYNSSSASNEYGNYFRMPFTGVTDGFQGNLDIDAPSSVVLWKNGSIVDTVVISSMARTGTSQATVSRNWTTPISFSKNDEMHLIFKPTTTGNVSLPYSAPFSSTSVSAVYPSGFNVYYTSATSATGLSSFVNNPARRMFMWLKIKSIDPGIPGGASGVSQ